MPPVNRVQDVVDRATAEGDRSPVSVEKALGTMDRNALRPDELVVWYEYWARCASDRADVDEAILRYKEGLERFPSSPTLAFGLKNERQRNRVDAAVTRATNERGAAVDIEACLSNLRSDVQSGRAEPLRPEESEAWHQLWASAARERGDRESAFERYRRALDELPDSARLRFGLGREHEFRGEFADAMRLFDGARFPSVPSDYAMVVAHYALLWNEPIVGLSFLKPMLDLVQGARETDGHFLHSRGLPFFDRLWRAWTALAFHAGPTELCASLRVLEPMEKNLEQNGYFELLIETRALVRGDDTLLVEWLRSRVARKSTEDERHRLALFEARALRRAEAERALRALGVDDELRCATLADLAARENDSDAEARHLASLSAEAVLRLTPDRVIYAGLVGYVGALRRRYVAERTDRSTDETATARPET